MAICVALIILCRVTLNYVVYGNYETNYRTSFDSTGMISETKLESGRSNLEKIERLASRSKLPRVGECWTTALESLRVSCSFLDDDTQARLALSFTSCFAEMVGSPNYLCERANSIKTCLSTLDSDGMDTFRQYFLHTQDMCYFIQAELWHQETDRAVNELQNVALEMGKTVSEQKNVAESILESQYSSHKIQSEMLEENYHMFERMVHIKTALEEFGHQATEQRVIFSEIFDKLQKMQKLVAWIQGEMSLIDLVSFYAIGILFCYFLTTSERTHGARVWMILTLAVALFIERCLYEYLAEYQMTHDEVLASIYYFRKVAVVWILGIWLIQYVRYRDYNAINNNLLADLRIRVDVIMAKMDEQMKQTLQILQAHPQIEAQRLIADARQSMGVLEDVQNTHALNIDTPLLIGVVEEAQPKQHNQPSKALHIDTPLLIGVVEEAQPKQHNQPSKDFSLVFQYELDSSDSEAESNMGENSNEHNMNNGHHNLHLVDDEDDSNKSVDEEKEYEAPETPPAQNEDQGRMQSFTKLVKRLVGRPSSKTRELKLTPTPNSQPSDQTMYHLRARENIHTPCRYTDEASGRPRRNSNATKSRMTRSNGYYSSDDDI